MGYEQGGCRGPSIAGVLDTQAARRSDRLRWPTGGRYTVDQGKQSTELRNAGAFAERNGIGKIAETRM